VSAVGVQRFWESVATRLHVLDLGLSESQSDSLADSDYRTGELLGFSSGLTDLRILFKRRPTPEGLAALKMLVIASGQSPAATQHGMTAYALLAPVLSAIEDLLLVARGDSECFQTISNLEESAIASAGPVIWKAALSNAKKYTGAVCILE
jgi:hypothetical protein